MKKLIISSLLFLSIFGFTQSYNEDMESAASFMQNKDYCGAFKLFDKNLNDKTSSYFEYYYGAISAVNCNNDSKAISWLQEAKNKGLGLQNGELENFKKDTNFVKFHNSEAWKQLIESIQIALLEKEKVEKFEKEKWIKTIKSNAISKTAKIKGFQKVTSGFALYFSEVNSQKVPYIVFVPKNYDNTKSSTAVVFLHGGVLSISDYYYENPDVSKEPIFKYGEENNTIIIYPFAKKDFGWVNQIEAFKNVVEVTKMVQKKYNINKDRVFLGGMSNGGSATFWFSTQEKMPYNGYFAISATPKLAIGNIDFQKISKPFWTINAKDDTVFKYDDVKSIYDKNGNKNWHFETVEEGGHGLIYGKNGENILSELLKNLDK